MKGNALVYLVAAIIGLIVLQVAVGIAFSFLPTILFFVATLVASLCTYAVYTEKAGRRIGSVDKLLGIVGVALPPDLVSVRSADAPKAASEQAPRSRESVAVAVSNASKAPSVPGSQDMINAAPPIAHSPAQGSQDDVMPMEGGELNSEPTTANPEASDVVPEPLPLSGAMSTSSTLTSPSPALPRPPAAKVDYGGLINDIKSKPIPKPAPLVPRSPSGGQSPSVPAAPKSVDYAGLVSRAISRAPAVVSKDDLIAAIAKNVIGQRGAIETLATYVRGKIGSRDTGKNKPLVFLLPGPTGTGKTEISKALAEALGTKLIRYDMGEYAEEFKASNLFGSSKGYIGSEDGGALPNAIRRGGKRLVVLFDEVEKAHQSLWQKMLAFMDEGRTGDSKGEVLAPKDTIILLTTNRQAEAIAKDPAAAREILRHDGYFSPEFMGRIEKVVPMPRLTDADVMKLTHRLLEVLARTYGLSVAVDDDALIALYSVCRDGAERSGGRGITESLKDLLIEDLLDLQGAGAEIMRLTLDEGRVRAISA